MVRLATMFCFAASALSAVGICHKHGRAVITPYDQDNCSSDVKRKDVDIKEGHCKSIEHFMSFEAYPYKPNKYPIENKHCRVLVFSDDKCAGLHNATYDLSAQRGICRNANFSSDPTDHRPHMGRAVRLDCEPVIKKKPQSSSKAGVTETKLVQMQTTTQTVTQASSSKHCDCTTTVSVTPEPRRSTSVALVSKVVLTTTILRPDVATITGSTTLWVAPPSSHSTAASVPSVITVKTTKSVVQEAVATVTSSTTIFLAPSPTGSTTTVSPSSSHSVGVFTHTVTYAHVRARQSGAERRAAEIERREQDAEEDNQDDDIEARDVECNCQ